MGMGNGAACSLCAHNQEAKAINAGAQLEFFIFPLGLVWGPNPQDDVPLWKHPQTAPEVPSLGNCELG